MTMLDSKLLPIGVVVVTYASSNVIEECISSLLASDYPELRIVIFDNASPDDTCDVVGALAKEMRVEFSDINREEAHEVSNPSKLTLIRSHANLGFAGGVNTGLKFLGGCPDVNLFWILNPDCAVASDAAGAYARRATEVGEFALMTGRMFYFVDKDMIQSDGGRVNFWTGMCRNVNQREQRDDIEMPDPDTLDFVSGANMVVSRAFIEQSGSMRDDYFLYYEEVDWAMRRGNLPIVLCPASTVFHHAGTSIGSGSVTQSPSALSNYFNYRNRMIFVRRFKPAALPVAYVYSFLKVIRLFLQGYRAEAMAAWFGLNIMQPPKTIAAMVDPGVHHLAFKKRHEFT